MQADSPPDLSLFQGILHTLERIRAPFMVIGAFAGAVYGVTRVTYDIDIVVDLSDDHVDGLASAYPPPRFYADPVQMRDSIRRGIRFSIIDTIDTVSLAGKRISNNLRTANVAVYHDPNAAVIPDDTVPDSGRSAQKVHTIINGQLEHAVGNGQSRSNSIQLTVASGAAAVSDNDVV